MNDKLIRIRKETKKRLDSLKIHPRETYNDVIIRLLQATGDVLSGVKKEVRKMKKINLKVKK